MQITPFPHDTVDDLIKEAAKRREHSPMSRRLAFSIAETCYKQAGTDDRTRGMFTRFLTDDPGPVVNKVASAVYRAMGRVSLEMEKESNFLTPIVAGGKNMMGMIGAGTGGLRDLIALVGLGGLSVGALGGAGAFGLERALTKDDPETFKLQRQRDTMVRLSREIDEELRRRKLKPTPKNTAAVVDYLT